MKANTADNKNYSCDCKIKGCGKPSRSKTAGVCEMHYYRYRRNGTYKMIANYQGISNHSNGYIKQRIPGHKLADNSGYVMQHRLVYFDAHGYEDITCSMCGKPETLRTCHIDHIDNNKKNNSLENLRLTCIRCNTQRTVVDPTSYANAYLISALGETKTPNQWAKDQRVKVSGAQIRRRKKKGMSDYDCLFAAKVTHNGC